MALAAANAKAPAPARGRGGRGDQRLAGALERVAELESENRNLREQAARRAQACQAYPLAAMPRVGRLCSACGCHVGVGMTLICTLSGLPERPTLMWLGFMQTPPTVPPLMSIGVCNIVTLS